MWNRFRSTKSKFFKSGRKFISVHDINRTLNNEAEIKKINEQLYELEKELEPVNRKLSDEKFTSKAPQHIIDRELRIQKEYQDKIEKLKESLKSFLRNK